MSENTEPPTLADYIQGKLKPVERRLGTLKKHLEQADIYFKYKGKKPLTEAEKILFATAKDYLKGVVNGNHARRRIWSDNRRGDGIVNAYPAALLWTFIRGIS